jgi:hypothetical protein
MRVQERCKTRADGVEIFLDAAFTTPYFCQRRDELPLRMAIRDGRDGTQG